ncbi:hypothetical protein RIF29_18292 [Crotalaria pallida]|uniref:PPC domain-containing protein n=1 Tax=Crotalaria pallida TaxID=3830 RepID=A0AAN9FLY4_CROPI
MAEYGMKMSSSQLFHTSNDVSSSSIGYHNNNNHALMVPQPQKRPRGRPTGSKNKPKQPVVLNQESEEEMNSMVIEVTPGFDVVEALVNYASLRNVGISVLSASGSIASVTLRHLIPHTRDFNLHGPFTLLSITGTYICGHFNNPLMDETSSSFSSVINLNDHPFASTTNAFGITLSGSQGEIFGGIVAGRVVAASTVAVTTFVFKNPDFCKVRSNGNDESDVGASGSGGNNDKMHNLLNSQIPFGDLYAM